MELSHEQTLEEFQAVRRLAESDDATGETAGLAALLVLLKAVPERTVGHTEFAGDLPPRMPPEPDTLGPLPQPSPSYPWQDLRFQTALADRRLSVGIHGLGPFNGRT